MSKERDKLAYQMYLQREDYFFHQPYHNEIDFYDAVAHGDIAYIEDQKRKYPASSQPEDDGKGKLSDDPIRNERYHFIVNTAIITRKCIEAGLMQEEAYTLSDLYIQKSDTLQSISELRELNDSMVMDFAGLMQIVHKNQCFSHHIRFCIKYIHENLHTKITISDLAKQTKLNASYLATLFKKETNMTIHSYIQKKRLETAANILIRTNHPCSAIAHSLCFSSQSHFILAFQKQYGLTPGEYRKKNLQAPTNDHSANYGMEKSNK